MYNKNIMFWIEFVCHIIYMMCVIIITLDFSEYQIAYPSDSFTYIIKLIFSTIMISIKITPFVKEIEETIVFRLLLWISLLSLVPDAIRCIMMLL